MLTVAQDSLYKTSSQNGLRNALNGSTGRTPPTSVPANKNPGYNGINRTEIEVDNPVDIYGGSGGQRGLPHLDSDIPENMYRPEKYDQNDPEGWIHRDKLAKIESEELQAAGINLANARKSISRGTSRRSNSKDGFERGNGTELAQRPTREEKIAQRSPPVVEEEDHDNWDLRSPEEIAADEGARSQAQSLKKTSSRIPILTSSPMPIPTERVERDTPLPRKRTLSNSMSPDDGTPIPNVRSRQNSSGSGMLLDTGESILSSGYRSVSTPSSPSKAKMIKPTATSSPSSAAKKTTPGQRKASVPGKSGPNNTNSPSQRPGTRSGENDRPRTAVNRPEGDPPWLATMYKPDPRLPPDQQIVPTHARKQQQAMWTDEGAVPSTYDREFAPLAVNTNEGLVKLPSPAAVTEKPGNQEAWPLKPLPPTLRSPTDQRPGTSGSQTASYSTMPKVQNLQVKSPVASLSQSPVRATFPKDGVPPPRMQQQRFDEEEQPGKKEKGCLGCCVIM